MVVRGILALVKIIQEPEAKPTRGIFLYKLPFGVRSGEVATPCPVHSAMEEVMEDHMESTGGLRGLEV